MKRFTQFLAVIAIIVGVLYATRYVRHQRARSLALPVVAELGGRVYSITAPFGGTEYYISFRGRTLTRDAIDRLVVLNELAKGWNHVGISLNAVTISVEDREYLKQLLPDVKVGSSEDDAHRAPAA